MTAEELRELRRKWVTGAPPRTRGAGVQAQLVIDDLIGECFLLREVVIRAYSFVKQGKAGDVAGREVLLTNLKAALEGSGEPLRDDNG